MSCNGDCGSCMSLLQVYGDTNDFTYDETYRHPFVGIISLTSRCNLACPYCFHEQQNKDMNFETAEAAAKFVLSNADFHKRRASLNFFGGEPLLKWNDIIVPLVEKYSNNLDWSMTTNGVLLDEDKVDFCRRHNIGILLSFDGVKEVQDTQRPAKVGSSFDMVKRNIPYLLLRFPDTVFRATVTKNSIRYLKETTNLARKLGFKHITFCPNFFDEFDEQDESLIQDFFDGESIKLMENIRDLEIPELLVGNIIKMYRSIELSANTKDISNSLFRCGQGIHGVGISTQGFLHPCQERNCDEEKDSIGDVFNGINQEKHEKEIRRRQDSYKLYLAQIDEIKGTNNFKRVMAENYCLQRLIEGYGMSSSNFHFTRALHKAASRLYWNYNLSMNPMAESIFKGDGEL